MSTLFERLVEERKRLGMSQTVFGSKGGVGKGSQINYEKGDRKPDSDYFEGVAEAGADVLYIITGARASYIGTQETSVKYTVNQPPRRAIDPEDSNADLFTLIDLYRYLNSARRAEVLQAVRGLAADQLNEEYDLAGDCDEQKGGGQL